MKKNFILGIALVLAGFAAGCGSDSNSNNPAVVGQNQGSYWQNGQGLNGYVPGQPYNGYTPYYAPQGCSDPILCGPRFNNFGPQGYFLWDYNWRAAQRGNFFYWSWWGNTGSSLPQVYQYRDWSVFNSNRLFPCEINQGNPPVFQDGVTGNTGVYVYAGQRVLIQAEGRARLVTRRTLDLSFEVQGSGQRIPLASGRNNVHTMPATGQLFLGFDVDPSLIRSYSVRIQRIEIR